MKYLVMECHPGYAVVLDADGRFLQVANEHFQVGQRVDEVMALEVPKQTASRRWVRNLALLAACLCLVILGAWQLMMPYGTVRMKINPEVQFSVNRFDYVLDIVPLNEDAKVLLQGYDPGLQKIDTVLDELADRAAQMGYLKPDGNIHVTVESEHEQWKIATQDRLIAELEVHTGGTVVITPEPAPEPEPTVLPEDTGIPTEPTVNTDIVVDDSDGDCDDDEDEDDEDDDDDEDEDDEDDDDDEDEDDEDEDDDDEDDDDPVNFD